jgi:serine protease Do
MSENSQAFGTGRSTGLKGLLFPRRAGPAICGTAAMDHLAGGRKELSLWRFKMRILKGQWIIALFGGLSMVAAAVTVAERSGPTVPPPVSVRDAHELSSVFRNVAATSLPCVVTIETNQKSRVITKKGRDPFEEFRDDPRFRGSPLEEFFRQSPDRQLRTPPQQGMGSGFIIESSGIIVTNNHVVADADEITVRLQDGREFKGTDVRTDPRTDVAILKIDAGEELPALRFGDSDAIQVGDWVIAVGNPFGNELTVTSGIISAKGRGPRITERENFLQTDAAVNPGNSGGPLLNLAGEVVGINTAISSRSGGFDGIAYAVPSKMAWWVVDQLMTKGSVERAYIGLSIRQITADIAQALDLKIGEGALVKDVLEKGPAAEAGLQPGDVILTLNEESVTGPRSLQGIVEKIEAGKSCKVKFIRAGKIMTLPIKLKAMPKDYSLSQVETVRPDGQKPSDGETATVGEFGFEVQDLTDEIAEQLDLEAEAGVVVSSVDEEGLASRSLALGDVIERVGSVKVTSLAEFNEALDSVDPKRGLLLLVRRGGATRFVVLRRD